MPHIEMVSGAAEGAVVDVEVVRVKGVVQSVCLLGAAGVGDDSDGRCCFSHCSIFRRIIGGCHPPRLPPMDISPPR